jgi:hypothetical protein
MSFPSAPPFGWWWLFTGLGAVLLQPVGWFIARGLEYCRQRLRKYKNLNEFMMIQMTLTGMEKQFKEVPNRQGLITQSPQVAQLVQNWWTFESRTKESLTLLEPEWGRRWFQAVLYGGDGQQISTYFSLIYVKRECLKDIVAECDIPLLRTATGWWYGGKNRFLSLLGVRHPANVQWNHNLQRLEKPDGTEWRSVWRPNARLDTWDRPIEVPMWSAIGTNDWIFPMPQAMDYPSDLPCMCGKIACALLKHVGQDPPVKVMAPQLPSPSVP